MHLRTVHAHMGCPYVHGLLVCVWAKYLLLYGTEQQQEIYNDCTGVVVKEAKTKPCSEIESEGIFKIRRLFVGIMLFIRNFQTWNVGRWVITIIHYSYS